MPFSRVCVFCGSSVGVRPAYSAAAAEMGRTLVARGIGLVYGGGDVGLMGVIANTVLDAGGEVIGVIPQALVDREVEHHGLTELHVVDSMHTRKKMMADLSDAFIAMPGGVGTFEEFFEVVTWTQLGIHRKPCGLLDVEGFYQPLEQFIDRAVAEGFIKPLHRGSIVMDTDPARLLDRLSAAKSSIERQHAPPAEPELR